jgi:hypothetical protein
MTVPAGAFPNDDDRLCLMDPWDFYGKPVFDGRCEDASIGVPVVDEFGPFVVIKD